MDEIIDQITLTLDDDSELLCDVLATFPATVNGKEQMYIALLPTDATPESEIYLYRFIEDGDDIDLQNIEDDEEFDYFCDCLCSQDWDCAETDYVKRFYVLVMDENGMEVLGYKDFGITKEVFDSLEFQEVFGTGNEERWIKEGKKNVDFLA